MWHELFSKNPFSFLLYTLYTIVGIISNLVLFLNFQVQNWKMYEIGVRGILKIAHNPFDLIYSVKSGLLQCWLLPTTFGPFNILNRVTLVLVLAFKCTNISCEEERSITWIWNIYLYHLSIFVFASKICLASCTKYSCSVGHIATNMSWF